MKNEVTCGFGKWSIGVDKDNGRLSVRFYHYPNEGVIYLHDLQEKDLHNLAEMFAKVAGDKPPRKAKDIPIGTKVSRDGMPYVVVGHGYYSDNVVVIENEFGDFHEVNCEDVKITSEEA